MKSRILATLAVSVVLLLAVGTPARADQPYTGALSANSCAPGATVTYNADNTGQPDGTTGTFTLSGDQSSALGFVANTAADVTHTIRVEANGQLTFSVQIPKDAKVGSVYKLAVKANKFSDQQSIKVIGVPASAPAASSSSGTWIIIPIVVVLIVLLALFLIVRRRRIAREGSARA